MLGSFTEIDQRERGVDREGAEKEGKKKTNHRGKGWILRR